MWYLLITTHDIGRFDHDTTRLFDKSGLPWSEYGVMYHSYTKHDVKSVDDTLMKECEFRKKSYPW